MIVVCGESLIDLFAAGDTAAGVALDGRVGGSPFNVAIGLARLAQTVSFFGAVSTGFLGERLMRALQDEGVRTDSIQRVDAPTTLGLVGLTANGVPSYAFYGEGGADRQLGEDALALLPADISAIHVGSFAAVVEPVASTLRTLVERARGRALISYDPNVRLNVVPDRALWRAAVARLLPFTDLLKISEEDLSVLAPGLEPELFARDALHKGVRLVVVTLGDGGARAWTASASATAPAVSVAVIDTVGAGDSLHAAMLAWLSEHDALSGEALLGISMTDLAAALRFGVHAAALTCSRRGADLPRRAELGS